jgi:hypothetical protein
MGGLVSHDHLAHLPQLQQQQEPRRHSSVSASVYPNEILCLRNEIKNKTVITLDRKYVFLLFGPPDYQLGATAEYFSSRLGLPVESSIGKSADYFITEIATNNLYKKGCIVCSYPVSVADVGLLKQHLDSERAQLYLFYFDVDAEVCGWGPPTLSVTVTVTNSLFDRHYELP